MSEAPDSLDALCARVLAARDLVQLARGQLVRALAALRQHQRAAEIAEQQLAQAVQVAKQLGDL